MPQLRSTPFPSVAPTTPVTPVSRFSGPPPSKAPGNRSDENVPSDITDIYANCIMRFFLMPLNQKSLDGNADNNQDMMIKRMMTMIHR